MRTSRLQVVNTAAPQAPAADVYLAGCLARIERLLRARALLWQATLARFKPDHLWGVPQVPHGEIDAQLACPPLGIDPAEPLPESAQQELKAASGMTATLSTLRASKINSPLRSAEESFGLLPAERDLLLLTALPEFDPRYRRLIGYLMDDAMLAWPTAEFARACLAPLHGDIDALLAPDATLLGSGLIETLTASSSGPRSQRGLKVCVEIVNWLQGGDGIDRELLPGADVRAIEHCDPAPHGILEVAGLMRVTPQLLVLAHGPGAVDPHPIGQLASAAGLALLSCPAAAALDHAKLRAIARSARLNRALLHIPVAMTSDVEFHAGHLGELLARHPDSVVLTAARPLPRLEGCSHTAVELRLPLPNFAQRCSFWGRLLENRALVNGHKLPALVRMLAERYRLSFSAMETAFAQADAMARMRGPRNVKLGPEDLAACCRRMSGSAIEFARRLSPEQIGMDLEHLILPPATHRRFTGLVRRLGARRRVLAASGLGERLPIGQATVALFTGPSGTGKTVAALLLAKRLGLDLLKADLGSLVSKYVGETEQRIDRLFAAAESTDAVLLFDEADALFAKRGEVKDARDRWANLEASYLLQRIEEFDGIVVLSTNLQQNIDDAFMRRIDVAINFPMPDAAQRRRLWRSLIPSGVEPPGDADLDRLADALPLSGGHIKSIVVDAVHHAYAVDEDSERPRLTARHLVEAAAITYEKLGRPVGPSEFTSEWLAWLREADGVR